MTHRTRKILITTAIALVSLVALGIVGVIVIVHTDWFRNYVRQKIVTAISTATGGRAEIGGFSLDLSDMQAVVTNLVVHGTEPAGAAPLLQIPRVQVNFRPALGLDITYAGVDHPQANIMVLPDGRSNIPTPPPSSNNAPPLQSVVNAAIGRFDLNQGSIAIADQKSMFDLHTQNFRAQLNYSSLKSGYQGQISFQPLYVQAAQQMPVELNVVLPVTIESNQVSLKDATISSSDSTLHITASVDDLRHPTVKGQVNGQIALTDLKKAGNLPLDLNARSVPSTLQLDADATVSPKEIKFSKLHLTAGHSDVDASGTLKSTNGAGGMTFLAQIDTTQIGRLLDQPNNPAGLVSISGTATLNESNQVQIQQNQGQNSPGGAAATPVADLSFTVHNLHVKVLGGEVEGEMTVQNFRDFHFKGDLKNVTLRGAAALAGEPNLPYAGTINGPVEATGNLKQLHDVMAQGMLSITPGRNGIPVSGRLNVDYNGAGNEVQLNRSFVSLPHSRLTIDGSVGHTLNVSLVTTDLHDLLAATSEKTAPPIDLHGHPLNFTGTVTGGLNSPHVAGHLRASQFTVEGRNFDSLAVDATASQTGVNVSDGEIARAGMRVAFSGHVGMNHWKVTPNQPLGVNAQIRNTDLADLLALAQQPIDGNSGTLNATAQVQGTLGNPAGSADFTVVNGTLDTEPFRQIQGRVNLSDRLIAIPSATVDFAMSRLTLTAALRHPSDSFTTGQLDAHVQSDQIDLAQLKLLQQSRPGSAGALALNITASADIGADRVQLTGVNGTVNARNIQFDGQSFGDLNLDANTTGQTVQYRLASTFAGSNIRANGNTQLRDDYPTELDASIASLPIQRVLAAARQTSIPASGVLSGNLHFAGTKDAPTGTANLDLTQAVLDSEPVNRVNVQGSYAARQLTLQQLQIDAPAGRITATALFDHPPQDLKTGTLQFQVNSTGINLAQVRHLQAQNPGLTGTLQVRTEGYAALIAAAPRIELKTVTADLAARSVAINGKTLGNASISANTRNNTLDFTLMSDFAGASIQGQGGAQLTSNYPVNAQLTFDNLQWAKIREFIPSQNGPSSFNVSASGQVSVQGPATKPLDMRGSLQMSKLNLTSTLQTAPRGGQFAITNQGPITASFDRGTLRIDSAHLSGDQTDIQAKGSLSLRDQAMNMNVDANANLAALQRFSTDITSSGKVTLAALIRGTVAKPSVTGSLQLQNASVHDTQFPNGLSNANGTVDFRGNSASIRNLTAESGGGKVTLSGFVLLANQTQFGLRASASNVRVDVQQGVSVVTDANITLSGTTAGSSLSGRATITNVTYSPQTDLGSFLTRAAPSIQAGGVPSPVLSHMKLDVTVETSNALQVRSSIGQNIEGTANLRVRGTASDPTVLGRVVLTEGSLTFFGTGYTLDSGTISFYNPVRIEPILDVSLATAVQGVNVTLRVTGSIDNMKLSYSSDPPLQFQEIVNLLATGKTPTSDPTLLANNPPAQQSVSEIGESALLGQAVANPVANQLERVFGVTQLKINPSFTNGSAVPQAELTLKQQITPNLTFTYVTEVNNANAQTIRVDLTLTREWSAAAMRDENGIFSVNLYYKRQFR